MLEIPCQAENDTLGWGDAVGEDDTASGDLLTFNLWRDDGRYCVGFYGDIRHSNYRIRYSDYRFATIAPLSVILSLTGNLFAGGAKELADV